MPVEPKTSAPAYETEVLMISRMRAILPQAFPILMNRNKWSHPWGVSDPHQAPLAAVITERRKDGS